MVTKKTINSKIKKSFKKTKRSIETNFTDYKNIIIKELNLLRKVELIKKDSPRVIAYTRAINSIKGCKKIINIDDVKNLKYIGSKIFNKIQKIINTGKLNNINNYRNDPQLKLYDEFKNIYGIGDVYAKKLVYELNINSISELKSKVDELNLNNNIRLGLKYYKDFLKKIPRKEMELHNKTILKCAENYLKGFDYKIEMVGSYRRLYKESGDIDVIISGKDKKILKILVNTLINTGYLKDKFAYGIEKYMGVCIIDKFKIHRRIDILYTTPEKYPFAVLYFTGSKDFNIKMRNIAMKKGYKLSEHGIKKIGNNKYYKISSEKDIFKFLDIKYILPENRTNNILDKYL